jgi:hypothetical protein
MIRDLPIDQIDGRSDARQIDEATVGGLVDSIGTVGLICPIRVRAIGDRWEVIAGHHRLAACTRLGLAEITADIIDADDLHAELAMLDENLLRHDLSPSERAVQTARRKVLYLVLYPDTAHGTPGVSRQVGDTQERTEAERFTANTAAATGQSERAVQRDAERGEKVIPEVIDMIRGTELDTGTFLDKIKKYPPNDQVAIATRELARIRAEERDHARHKKAAKLQAGVKAKAAQEAAEIIAEYVPGEWLDAIKANLYAAGAKNVADVLTNIISHGVLDWSDTPLSPPAPRFPGASAASAAYQGSMHDGAKMEGRHSVTPERAHESVKSNRAATNSHSPSVPPRTADMAEHPTSSPDVSASNSSEAA